MTSTHGEHEDDKMPTNKFVASTLHMYSDGDQEFEKDLIDSYKQSVTVHLADLGKAFTEEKINEVILHSHTIKSSSDYIGAEAVRWISEKIERHCKLNNDMKAAQVYYPDLSKEIKEVLKLLDKYLGEDVKDDDDEEQQQQQPPVVNKDDGEKKNKDKDNNKDDTTTTTPSSTSSSSTKD